MKIINPTDHDITVTIEGTVYSIEGKGELTGVKEEHALYWKKRLHSFLTIHPDAKVEKPKVEEVVDEVAKEEVTKKVIKK